MFFHLFTTITIIIPEIFQIISQPLSTAGKLDITPDDPRWIGAWWGGFLLCGALLFLSALFMFGFPQALDEQHLDGGGESEQAMLPPSLTLDYPGSKPRGSMHGFDMNSGLSVCEHLRGEDEQMSLFELFHISSLFLLTQSFPG